ncbi:SHC-transforming protein 1-like isoform X1 [Pungitius pungitius]|uniref:SHC-transforming protein 1-like isoform X1 n=1 Tax=Pungitius pungitius TaxID=134920 RepID=UPI002E0D809E
MREQTSPRFKSQTGLLPGMLKRTKYSRLRSDSLTPLEDRPQRGLPSKRDLCLHSDFAQVDPRVATTHQGPSTLRDFIPRVASVRWQSPVPPRGQASTDRDGPVNGHADGPLSRAGRGSGPEQRLCGRPALDGAPSDGQNLTHAALRCTKRPITLHRVAGLPWTSDCAPCSQHGGGPLKTPSAAEDGTPVGTESKTVHHHIKYMGSVEVTQSMRTLDFDMRMKVTREAISRLCERTSAVKTRRPVCKALPALLGQINLQFSGSRIVLTVSTDSVSMIAASSFQKIAHHPMQAVSFASGGDPDMANYIAYVAKDLVNQRACHILECPRGRASEVINSIGQAFEDRFRRLLNPAPSLLSNRSAAKMCPKWSPEERATDPKANQDVEASEQRDYYNVVPRKTPPAGGGEENEPDPDIFGVCSFEPLSLYENCSVTEETPAPPAESVACEAIAEPSETLTQDLIQEEVWFHGRLGRDLAESLLTHHGDFLVRESSSASGQYVLSGMEGATARHLLLVDPLGQVRTRDQVFLSVGHLVRFHMENKMPIISGSIELCLRQPILQRH